MFDWLNWFTDMQNTKPLALVMFFICFVGIIGYVYLGKNRSKRFEAYRYIPLDDGQSEPGSGSRELKDE